MISADTSPLVKAFQEAAKKVAGKAILASAADSLVNDIGWTFRSGTDPWGSVWAPLKFRAGQPLNDTGRLKNSIDSEVTNDYAIVGTNVCYGIVHQYGATVTAGKPTGSNICGYQPKGAKLLHWETNGIHHFAKSVHIPARPFMPIHGGSVDLPDAWERSMIESIKAEFAEA